MTDPSTLIERLRSAKANGDPAKYAAFLTVAEAWAAADLIEQQAAQLAEMREGWLPIETAPRKGMFVVIGVTAGNGFTGSQPYVSDPVCVWRDGDGFARWQHHWPPTHWRPLPAPPVDQMKGEG